MDRIGHIPSALCPSDHLPLLADFLLLLWCVLYIVRTNVPDPNPHPHVFGPAGSGSFWSGSISQRHGAASRFGSTTNVMDPEHWYKAVQQFQHQYQRFKKVQIFLVNRESLIQTVFVWYAFSVSLATGILY
jgi:hypothetical protein